MKIAVIGGGFTGLSAAYYLSKQNCEVIVFEKENTLGGLAASFKNKGWKWRLEKYYHHLFLSDKDIIKLATEVGCKLTFSKPKTSIYYDGVISSFQTPLDMLRIPSISLLAKIRTGFAIAILKMINNWEPLEKITAYDFINKASGRESWEKIWSPLFKAKFDKDFKKIPTSWFWARIKKRGNTFGYPEEGFERLAALIVRKSKTNGVKFKINSDITKIIKNKDKFNLIARNKNFDSFDKIIFTGPGSILAKITPSLSSGYKKKLTDFKWKATVNLILSLNEEFMTDGTYWININDTKFPFIGVIEQTNFVDKRKYNGDNIIYVANYLPIDHPLMKAGKNEILKIYTPYLAKINPKFNKKMIKKIWIFKSAYAQPVMTLNYSKKMPTFETPINNLYLANMQQVYPWDRQTNYAVELGKKISEVVTKAS